MPRRDFTATVFVVNDENQVLLVWHRKFGKWMPPGGHIDPNELPEDAAIRECKEETGIDIELVDGTGDDVFLQQPDEGRMLKRPFSMLLEYIPAFPGNEHRKPEEAHDHIDCIFVGKPTDMTQNMAHNAEESDDIRWFSAEDLSALPEEELFANVRLMAGRILASNS